MSNRERAGGFTLIELVLAMTALALLTAVCYAAFHLAIRAIERGEVAVTTAQRLRATSDVLRQIRSAAYRFERDEGCVRKLGKESCDPVPYFHGTATSMSFNTNLRLQGGGGVSRVTYQLLDNPTRLVMTEGDPPSLNGGSRRGRDRDQPPPQQSTVLLDGFRTLNFWYYDLSQGEWRQSWDTDTEQGESEGLPLAVRLVIDGVPGIESGQWGAEFPIDVVAMSESVSEGGADTLEEVFSPDQEDEDVGDDDDDEDDDGAPAASRPGARAHRGGVDDE